MIKRKDVIKYLRKHDIPFSADDPYIDIIVDDVNLDIRHGIPKEDSIRECVADIYGFKN